MSEIKAESFLQLVNDVVVAGATHDLRRVRVATLRPRDVGSMMLVVKMAKDGGDRRWKIVNVERLRRMELAVDLLVVLESALLPALALFLDNSSLITALGAYNLKVTTNARSAGGAFSTKAGQVCNSLTNYIQSAAGEDADLDQLKALVDPLIDEIKALLDADVTVARQ